MIDNIRNIAKINEFFNEQLNDWEFARNGYESLKNVKVKSFQFDNATILVQNNPKRIISSSAKVDEKSINERPCFLCEKNLPIEQKSIELLDKYLLLINPFPILPIHFTIPTRQHIPQRITDSIKDMLAITKILGESFLVFYNGPKCGASAPDHMHFQAGSRGFLPVNYEYSKTIAIENNLIVSNKNISIYAVKDVLRNIIVLESDNIESTLFYFGKIYSLLNNDSIDEPLLNILCIFDEQKWKLIIFPRKRHRPAQFYEEGESKLLLSPASVDFGGVCILPRIEDFDKITNEILVDIFKQLTLDNDEFEKIIDSIKIM